MVLKVVATVSEDVKHRYDVESLCLCGDKLLSAADDGKVKVWKTDNLSFVTEISAHPEAAVYDVTCFKDRMYTCGNDGKLKLWSMNDWSFLKDVHTTDETIRKVIVYDGRIYAGDEKGNVHVIREYDGLYIVKLEQVEEVWDLKVRGNELFTIRDRGLTLCTLYEHANGPKAVVRKTIEGSAPIAVIGDLICLRSKDGMSVDVWKDEKPAVNKIGNLKGGERIITCITPSTDGTRLYGAGWDNKLFVWNLQTLALEDSADLPDCANSLAVGENGDVFAAGSDGFVVKLSRC